MKTIVNERGTEVTRMSSREAGLLSPMRLMQVKGLAKELGIDFDEAREVQVLIDSHGLGKQDALKIWRENVEWANS